MKITSAVTIPIALLILLSCSTLFADIKSESDEKEGSEIQNSDSAAPSTPDSDLDTGYSNDDFMFDEELMDDLDDFEEPHDSIADPLEPFNRAMFHFNDKLILWVLKPTAKGYSRVVPEPARRGVKNFFKNISFPVRFVSCILQGKFEGAGIEVDRFLINSTIGFAGFMDPAASKFNMREYDEDLGQTLGSYGIGHGFFINWPILGASSVTRTMGTVGDAFLEPLNYADMETKYDIGLRGLELVNDTSFIIGDYEDLKKAALDPYVAYRNAYYQLWQSEIKK